MLHGVAQLSQLYQQRLIQSQPINSTPSSCKCNIPYLPGDGCNLVDKSFTAQLNVIAEQNHFSSVTFDLSSILQTAVQDPVIVGLNCQMTNFTLHLGQTYSSTYQYLPPHYTPPTVSVATLYIYRICGNTTQLEERQDVPLSCLNKNYSSVVIMSVVGVVYCRVFL